ncbi:hypothetical protein [Acetobacter aceti]
MTREFPDHGQTLAEFQRIGCKGMAEIVNADAFQSGFLADAPPRLLQIGQMSERPLTFIVTLLTRLSLSARERSRLKVADRRMGCVKFSVSEMRYALRRMVTRR